MTDSTAIARCCARISQRAQDVRLLMVPGLADDLRSIGEAFASIQSAQATLASAFLAKHYGYNLTQSDYQALVELERGPMNWAEGYPCPKETKP